MSSLRTDSNHPNKGGGAVMRNGNGAVSYDSFDLFLAAMQTVLTHDPSLLTVCNLGRLSTCSNILSSMAEETGAWKKVFEDAAAAGHDCRIRDLDVYDEWQEEHPLQTWDGERGLLECFVNPSSLVVASTGYKRAARCLLTKTCFHCGKMAGMANPVTLMRTCQKCSMSKESLWLISKSKAKEAFLLTDRECGTLPSANVVEATVFLITDVIAASFRKHGGAGGLAAELAKGNTTAANRYNKSQNTSEPQKKRRKIEKVTDRPADNLSSLQCVLGSSMSIPTAFVYRATTWQYLWQCQTTALKMTHCVKCKHCEMMGSTKDILMHERLEHKVCSQLAEERELLPCPPFEGLSLTIPVVIQPATELVQLIENAVVEHTTCSSMANIKDNTRKNSLFSFGDCKVAVDCELATFDAGFSSQCLTVWCQTGQNMIPAELLSIMSGEGGRDPEEAHERTFEALKKALGLEETKSKKLLAALISRALPSRDFLEVCQSKPDEAETPVLYGAWTYLKYGHPDNSHWGAPLYQGEVL